MNLVPAVTCFERFEHYDESENLYSCTNIESLDWVEIGINEICELDKNFTVFTAKENSYAGRAEYHICCTIKEGWRFEYTSGEVNSGCWKRVIKTVALPKNAQISD